jgi:glycosyltransferase involved in cell wall biosynthesis
MPRVSVVMSVFNGQRHLRTSLDGILAQEFRDFEFLVVNDGSTDGTRTILSEYEARDARIRVIDQENAGLTAALRKGCALAIGEFIARQDADDWSHPLRLERSIELLDRSPQVVMVSSWTQYVDPLGDVVETVERPADPDVATRRLLHERSGPPAHGSVTFRRDAYEAAGGYRACFYYAQDSDLWLRMGERGLIAYVPQYLYHARLSPEGVSAAHSRTQWLFGELGQQCRAARAHGLSEAAFLAEADALRGQLLNGAVSESGRRGRQAAANYRIGTSLSRRRNPRAREYFRKAIRLNPLHWRSWCRLCAEMLLAGRRTDPDDHG